ncbi:hypothetical protein [Streptomyces kaniharaensis]|uniref:hypothetical protein n=1 Tax=Streptomyces kaniharaensis TaxID=212423 RepID=UPI0012949193|nr:hypothetical protein [Streptomyces kaniharaensis]
MPRQSMAGELREILGEDAWRALEGWMRETCRTARTARPGRIGGGGTDAAVVSIAVEEDGCATRKALLKHCPPGERARREAGAHKRAFQLSPEGFRDSYLVDQPWDPVPLPDGGCLMFQDIAFGDLDGAALLGDRLGTSVTPELCAAVVRAVLSGWNPEAETEVRTVHDVLAPQLGPRLADSGKLARWAATVPGLWGSTAPGLRFPDGTVTPNPLAMARGHEAFADIGFDVLVGRAHGDLHPGNVLLDTFELARGNVEFRLIDLASFGPDLPLAHDPMTLLLSVADLALPTDEHQQEALRRHLLAVDPEASDDGVLPTNLRNAVAAVHRTGLDWARRNNWGGEWRMATRLALAANALLFIGWSREPARQWWYLRLAASAAAAFMQQYDRHWTPTDVFPLPDPAEQPATPTAPSSVAVSTAPDTAQHVHPGDPAQAALRDLERCSRSALKAAGHHDGTALGDATLDLASLYVERDLEWSLLRMLNDGESACVVGAPGMGKTTLLWRLYARLAAATASAGHDAEHDGANGRRPYLLRAGDLCAREADRSGAASVSLEQLRTAGTLLRERAAFLVDTADVLLSQPGGDQLLLGLLDFAAEHAIPLLLTSRDLDSHRLRGTADDYRLGWKQLGPYNDREQDEAVRTHARYFYARNAEVSVEDVYQAVTTAAVKGLPLREVCRVPLTLRLLFEVSAPGLPDVAEVDATNLYDRYWEHRIRRDLRAGTAPAETADVSRAAEALAELMLAEGRPELPAAAVRGRLPGRMAPFRPEADAAPGLDALVTRGVVERQGEGALLQYSFFHQTLFEYAAGHGLCALEGRGLGHPVQDLLDWLRTRPNDQFRLAVVEQALVQAGRSGGGVAARAEALLEDLARDPSPEHNRQALLLRVYARLPQPGPALRAAMAGVLDGAVHVAPNGAPNEEPHNEAPYDDQGGLSAELAQVYLEALPGVCHRDPARIADELHRLWRTGNTKVRWAIVDVLCRFAESFPESAVATVDRTCPRLSVPHRPGACGLGACEPDRCLWAWLVARVAGQESEVSRALHLLEALGEKHPRWVWPRLRALLVDPRRQLVPLARCIRLAARPYEWPETPFTLIRVLMRRRWPGDSPTGEEAIRLQAALGRMTAAVWLARPADRQPPLERVLGAAVRRPKSLTSHAQVRAVGDFALRAAPDRAGALLAAAVDCSTHGNKMLLTDGLLVPLLTADQARTDSVGGDTPAGPAPHGSDAVPAIVRGWLAGQLRLLADPSPAAEPELLAVHAWGRALPVETVAALLAEAWPDGAPGSPAPRVPSADTLQRVWLTDKRAESIVAAGAAAGHRHAITALRLWRERRAALGHEQGKAERSHVNRTITTCLQPLLPRHPELLDHLFADGTVDRFLDPGWLAWSLRKAAADEKKKAVTEDVRLTAALRRHSATLTALCQEGRAGQYGSAAEKQSQDLWARLIERGAIERPSVGWLLAALRLGGHPHARKATLLLARSVVEHSAPGTLSTVEREALDAEFRRSAAGEGVPEYRGDSRKWQAECEDVARECRAVLTFRHSPITPASAASAARRAAQRHLLEATEAAQVTVVGRLLERLAVEARTEAVTLFGVAARRLAAIGGSLEGVVQRWYRPVSELAARTDREQWEHLVRLCWEGPPQLQRLLIRVSIRRRTDDPAAFLLATAADSGNPTMVVETVRIGERLNTRSGSERWTGLE